MREKICMVLLGMLLAGSGVHSGENEYHFSIDLRNVKDDKLEVILTPPPVMADEVVYRMPKIVPGTYEIYDFGRFISDFSVYDKSGKLMTVEKKDENSWLIKDAKNMGRISYWVEDSWDTEQKEKFVFEPAGTNIEHNENFVINTHGFFGYFDGMKTVPYRLTITKPDGFYGSTGLSNIIYEGEKDIYSVPNYMELADSPIMYNRPDTTVLNVGGARVLVSVYSREQKKYSGRLGKEISRLLEAQKEYLGGKLPVDKYAFIMYLFRGESRSGASGALEHSYSSVYFIPEMEEENLIQTVIDFSAHEFFHIVTPLNIHSEEIGNFDYNNPEMSRHLWLYEGITEYSAGLVQVKHKLIEEDRYLEILRDKIVTAGRFNDTLPFTQLSLGCLDKYREEYVNVYYKGALIGMCLDIKLRYLSDGKYGIQELLRDLSKSYGKNVSFKDEELFDKITQLTYPEIGHFLQTYVNGNTPLPLKEIFSLAGISYTATEKVKELSFGGFDCIIPKEGLICISEPGRLDEVGRKMRYKSGDVILKLNSDTLNLETYPAVLSEFRKNFKPGDKFTITVARINKKDKIKIKTLKGRVKLLETERKHVIRSEEELTQKQQQVKNAWLGRVG